MNFVNMSQKSKKVGLKKLSNKSNSKLTKETKTINEQSATQQCFDSFISLSSSNQDGNKDDSLIVVGSISKNVLSQDSQTDFFKFSEKNSSIVCSKQSCLPYPVPTRSKSSVNLEQHVSEITENESISNEKYVRVSNLFNDSSLLFENNTRSFNKNKSYDNSESITVKALNKDLVSKNDYESEVNTSLEDNITIPNMIANDCDSKSYPNSKEPSEQSHPETVQQCPICLKTVSKYVSHMKSCAAKNKLNTQQLLSALQLHKKQLAERKELGLDVPAQSYRAKVSPKRQRANDKKGPRDANLQLALALSASLRSAEEDEIIQEAEALKKAGLTLEANHRLGTLEQFGFASAVAPQPRSVHGSSKSRPLPRSLLLERSKEERERIVTEKIAIVLISDEENFSFDSFDLKEPSIKSKLLKKAWNKECQLWVKAHCPAEEERSKFYVDSLLEFVSPCKIEVGTALRRLSQLPGRLNTPDKENLLDLPSTPKSSLAEENNIFELSTPSRLLADSYSLVTAPTVHKSLSMVDVKNQLSEDWKSFVNNPELSDMEIQCEDGNVPAHRLVFHVRCPKVLLNVNQENNKNVLVLKNFSKTAAVAMLEFVYGGSSKGIFRLNKEDFKSLNDVVEKLDLSELKTYLRRLDQNRESFSRNESISVNFKGELVGVTSESQHDLCGIESLSLYNSSPNLSPLQAHRKNSFESNSETLPETELCPSIELESANSSVGRVSPDMFGESNIVENKSLSIQSQHDLDMLASLVGKTTGIVGDKLNEPSKIDFSKAETSSELGSLSDSLVNELSGKRKAFECSDGAELSLLKRPCSEWSKKTSPNNSVGENVFDLTQSSNSNEDVRQDGYSMDMNEHLGQNSGVLYMSKNNSCETIMDDSMEGLTQKDPSVPNSPQSSLSSYKKTPESRSISDPQDYFEPAWDGYDDYIHFNYTPMTTPVKPLADMSTEKKRSQNKSKQGSSQFSFLKTNTQKPSLFTPKILSDVNYISSDTNSPKQSSQQTLDEYSGKSNIHDSKSPISFKRRGSKYYEDLGPGSIPKPRKNLSSQFDNTVDTPKPLSSAILSNTKFSHISNLSKRSLETSPRRSDDYLKNSSLKRDSLIAMQRLLDDSFDINDSVLANADAILTEKAKFSKEPISPHPSTTNQSNIILDTNKSSMTTPTPEIIASDNVTPLPDYSAMKTPSLKRELSKYGLKPSLGKRKAKLMLRYIYDQTHPFVPDPVWEHDKVFKQPGPPPLSPMKSPRKIQSEINLVDSESDTEDTCSQLSTSSVSSSVTLPEESFCEFDDVLTEDVCSVGDLKSAIRSLIVNNADLHRRVLMYEPVFLDEFMNMLKANGIKSKVNDVMDYLDEQCITFRTNSWKATNKKRKQKNLKKKTKDASQGETSNSRKKSTSSMDIGSPEKDPSGSNKSQPKPVKKRGRPKKYLKQQDS